MNPKAADTTTTTPSSCSSQSVNSGTTSCSSQEDLEWDNYSPPLTCSCTDECSCTSSGTPCASCRRLASSCHSCIGGGGGGGGPCPSLVSWPESRFPCSSKEEDMSRMSSFVWLDNRGRGGRRGRGGVVGRPEEEEEEEADSQITCDDLHSMDSPSCSRTSRIVSSTQEGVLEASIVLSGKPSSASIDFRRKCTAYWDGVRSLHSIETSTDGVTERTIEGEQEEEDGTEQNCVSAYSLLSLTDSDSSHSSSALRIFHSFSVPNGKVRLDRFSVTRTLRPHSADDICRFRISSSPDDRPMTTTTYNNYGHQTKRVCSAVQFSQTVTTHCYDDGKYSFHAALPVRQCDAIIIKGREDQSEEDEEESSDTNREEDDSCNDGHYSKQLKGQKTKYHRDRDEQLKDRKDHCKEQCNRCHRLRNPNEGNENPRYQDPIDCCQCCDDLSDQLRDHSGDARQHPWNIDHTRDDIKLPDNCCDSKDQHKDTHHIKKRDDHCHDPKDRDKHAKHKRDLNKHGNHNKDHNKHGNHKRDHNRHGLHKKDHCEDHHHNKHRNRQQHQDSKRHGDKSYPCGTKTDARDSCDLRKHNPDCCDDSTGRVDRGNHGHPSKGRFLDSIGQQDDCQQKRENSAFCCDFEDSTHRRRDLRSTHLGSKDQSVGRPLREGDQGDSYNDSKHKSQTDNGCRFDKVNYDCAQVRKSDNHRSSSNHKTDGCCLDNCCCKECASKKRSSQKSELHGYRQHCKHVRDSDDSFGHKTDHGKHKDQWRHKHKECGYMSIHDGVDEGHFQVQQGRDHSNADLDCCKVTSANDVHKDPSFKTYKVSESGSRVVRSDPELDFEEFVKALTNKQSRYLDSDILFPGIMNYSKARVAEEDRKVSAIRENETRVETMGSKCAADNACSLGNSPNLRSSATCDGTRPEDRTEELLMVIGVHCCEYPEIIPPLEYFMVRARCSIEGDLDERPTNESPLLYQPRPPPLRSCTPQPPRDTYYVEPVHELQSRQCFEPRLSMPPLMQRPISRVLPQGSPFLYTAQPALPSPARMPGTPVLAVQSTVDGDRRPTSIRDKAENMPIVRRFVPTQMGDVTDVYQIEAFSNRRSWGLRPQLVSDDLVRASSVLRSSFVESERRLPSKSVGWAEEVAPAQPARSDSAACVAIESLDSLASSCTTQDRGLSTDSRPTTQSMNSYAKIPGGYRPTPGCLSATASSMIRSILGGSRGVLDESRISSSMVGGSKVSTIAEESSRIPSSMSAGCRLSSSIPVGSRRSSVAPNDGRSAPFDRSSCFVHPDNSETSLGLDEAAATHSMISDFENCRRHSFAHSDCRNTVRLTRQAMTNAYGLTIAYFNSQIEVLVAASDVAQADIRCEDASITVVEVIPAIEDLIVQIPSQTEAPPCSPSMACDDSDVTCLKELLAVPLRRRDDSDSEISADGRACKALYRSSDPCLGTSTFCQRQLPCSSKQPYNNSVCPSENSCLCTSVTQVISRSMKHGTDGDNECCAAVRDKCSSSKRSKWYRSLSSKTIPDIHSDDSLADGNSSSSETRSSNRTSTWVDCYTLPGSEPRHETPPGGYLHHHHVVDAADVYGEEMQEVSSCTDSVTTIYTRLPPTSSARQRAINCCTLATESCDENCFTRTTKCCKESERRRPGGRKSRRSSPETMMSCGHRCRSPKTDKIVSSTVAAALKHRQSSDWNGGGRRSREQSFERKYKALKRYCIDTLGCIPPPPTPLCFER